MSLKSFSDYVCLRHYLERKYIRSFVDTKNREVESLKSWSQLVEDRVRGDRRQRDPDLGQGWNEPTYSRGVRNSEESNKVLTPFCLAQ